MDELSAILCHKVPPIRGSSHFSMPGVHIYDINHLKNILPLFLEGNLNASATGFEDFRNDTNAAIIALSYIRSQTYQDRGANIWVYNIDPQDASKQPVYDYFHRENQMFEIRPESVHMPEPFMPVTDYNIAEIKRLAVLTASYVAYFQKREEEI